MEKKTSAEEIINGLKAKTNEKNRQGMARFGINAEKAFGVNIPVLRKMAKDIGKDHKLAQELWDTEIHEARLLAGFIDDHKQVDEKQMERWVRDFDSWDICDQCCSNLFDKTPYAYDKAFEWSARKEEYVKRAGFVLMACLAVHDKKASDAKFKAMLPIIAREARDERNFVKKAVNWALRQIGKRNKALNKEAIKTGLLILKKHKDSKAARWVANDAIRELKDKSKIRIK